MARRILRRKRRSTKRRSYRGLGDYSPVKAKGGIWTPNLKQGTDESIKRYGKTARSANYEQSDNRRKDNYRGMGDYGPLNFDIPAIAGGVGSLIGRNISKNKNWGGKMGDKWGRRISSMVGLGDYSVGVGNGNQLMGEGAQPMMVNEANDYTGDIYFSHREFIQNIRVNNGGGSLNTSPFQLESFELNPGIETTFPFLSQIANCFTLYDMEGMIFEYKSTSGEGANTNNNQIGKVIIATNYDSDAPDFINSVQMENYDYSNSGKPSENLLHGVETANKQQLTNMLYVRNGSTKKDLVLTDIGKLQIGTEGIPVPSDGSYINIGELWVSYRVRLSRASLFYTTLHKDILFDHFFYTKAAAASSLLMSASNVNSALIARNLQVFLRSEIQNGIAVKNKNNNLGGQLIELAPIGSNAYVKYIFPKNLSAGIYLVQMAHEYPSTTNVATFSYDALAPTLVNCRLPINNAFDTFSASGANLFGTRSCLMSGHGLVTSLYVPCITFLIEVTGQDASFTIGLFSFLGASTPQSDHLFLISQFNSSCLEN